MKKSDIGPATVGAQKKQGFALVTSWGIPVVDAEDYCIWRQQNFNDFEAIKYISCCIRDAEETDESNWNECSFPREVLPQQSLRAYLSEPLWFLRHPCGWCRAELYLKTTNLNNFEAIRYMSCCIRDSEETDGSEKLGLRGKFLLLSYWLKHVRRLMIGRTSTNQRPSNINQSETFIQPIRDFHAPFNQWESRRNFPSKPNFSLPSVSSESPMQQDIYPIASNNLDLLSSDMMLLGINHRDTFRTIVVQVRSFNPMCLFRVCSQTLMW